MPPGGPARAAVSGLVVAVVALTVAACGAPRSSVPVIMPTPAADPFASAIIMTRSWGSAEASIDGVTVLDGRAHPISGHGHLGLDEGLGSVIWSAPDGPVTELVTDRAVFTSTEAGWVREPGRRTDTSCLVDPLRGLADAAAATQVPPAEGLRRYRVQLPLTEESLACAGMSMLRTAAILAWPGLVGSVAVTGWVDANHRLVRIDRELAARAPGHSASATITTRLRDFGVMLDLDPPPSASVSTRSPR